MLRLQLLANTKHAKWSMPMYGERQQSSRILLVTLAVRIQVSEAHVDTGSSSIQLKYSMSASLQKRREAFVITFSFVRYSVSHHHFSYLTMDSEYLDRAAFGLSVASAINVVDQVLEVAELLKVRKYRMLLNSHSPYVEEENS